MFISDIYEKLDEYYPYEIRCMLDFTAPWQLLVAARLSAQCTDKRVNVVTKKLFEEYPNAGDLAEADLSDVMRIIKPCGLFRTKSAQIIELCRIISHGGYFEKLQGLSGEEIILSLCSLPGIGRKTANLAAGELYGKPCAVCDTHMLRVMNRLGIIEKTAPAQAEKIIKNALSESGIFDKGLRFSHMVVTFGREICSARKPKCTECIMRTLCPRSPQRKNFL